MERWISCRRQEETLCPRLAAAVWTHLCLRLRFGTCLRTERAPWSSFPPRWHHGGFMVAPSGVMAEVRCGRCSSILARLVPMNGTLGQIETRQSQQIWTRTTVRRPFREEAVLVRSQLNPVAVCWRWYDLNVDPYFPIIYPSENICLTKV